MPNSYRINQIYSLLITNKKMSVDDLAEKFHVTPTTIRRDLLVLEEKGLIERTRGFACISSDLKKSSAGIFEDEKKRIAQAAMKYVKNRMSIAMDSGSTVYELCDAIIRSGEFHLIDIVTHSLEIGLLAGDKAPDINVSMPGGAVQQKALAGVDVANFYKNINVDIAFLGSTGILNCRGLTVSYPLQLSVKQNVVACATTRIALLDSSKFLSRGIYVFCNFSDIDKMITVETEENKAQLDHISRQGVEIILV